MADIGVEEFVNLFDDEEVDKSGNEKSNNEDDTNHENSVDYKQCGEVLKNISELTPDDIRSLVFCSEDEACKFYENYARYSGFASRKDDVYRDINGNIVTRQLVCNKAGQRQQKHMNRNERVRKAKGITRVGCPARFRVRHDFNTLKWTVVFFEDKHNHELTPAEQVHLIPAFRGLSDGDKAQVDSLKLYGVRSCNIMGLIIGQKGGHENAGFLNKDLYNHCDKEKRGRIKDGDSVAALSYLQGKADSGSLFHFKFSKSDDGCLKDLFWCDGVSHIDYNIFGDVIAFDTTYKKNKYNKPLVIFCGYNHHKETTIFAAAIISNETYKWVLEKFCEATYNRHPKAVVTDGDGSMREAIKAVFPSSTHRLCAWHIQQNACENIKNPRFLEEFKTFVYANYSADRFDEKWEKVIKKYGLAHNSWMKKMYDMKSFWASTFMKDKFFAGIRTTSMCEGINSFIKKYVQCKMSLVDFLHNFERAVKEYRHNELTSDFKSTYYEPVLTTALSSIEEDASKLLTRKMFFEVRSEIEDALALNVVDRTEVLEIVMLKMRKFKEEFIEFVDLYDKNQKKFVCDCGLFEFCGIPCCHIICAMRSENVGDFNSSMISKRWLKTAKRDQMHSFPVADSDSKKTSLLRRGAMSAACNFLTQVCCENVDDFNSVMADIYKLAAKVQQRRNPSCNERKSSFVVGDPTIVKTKGAPRKRKNGRNKKHCSNCKRTGHTIRRCPALIESDLLPTDEGVESSMEGDEDNIRNDGGGEGIGNGKKKVITSKNKSSKRKSEDNCCIQKVKRPMYIHTTQDSVNQVKHSPQQSVVMPSKEESIHDLTAKIKAEDMETKMATLGHHYWSAPYIVNYTGGFPMFSQFPQMNVFPSYPQFQSAMFSQGYTSQNKFMGMLDEAEMKAKVQENKAYVEKKPI